MSANMLMPAGHLVGYVAPTGNSIELPTHCSLASKQPCLLGRHASSYGMVDNLDRAMQTPGYILWRKSGGGREGR